MKVLKKNDVVQDWEDNKIRSAVEKSALRVNEHLTEADYQQLITAVKSELSGREVITVSELHRSVELNLFSVNKTAGRSYQDYRNYKKDFVSILDELYVKTKDVIYSGDKENSNFESTLVSTKGSLVKGYLGKELYKKFYLSTEELTAIEDGFLYIHDMRDSIFGGINCCLFDMSTVLCGGFEMSNLKYSEPNSVLTALQVIGDVTLATSAQQFGGFTIPEIDKVIIPYMKKTLAKHQAEAKDFGINNPAQWANKKLKEELSQGFQSLEMKLNSIPSARGDFAFTTFSFGAISEDPIDRELQRLACEVLLDVRMKGQGKGECVVFPKLVFLFSQKQYDAYDDYKGLFDKAIKCSSRAMYPDYLAIDTKGKVAEYYIESGEIVSPMGCRAYLSDFKGEDGKSFFTGRANIGAVALNLPMIWKESEGTTFYEDLDNYLETIRQFHKKRYELIANTPCSSNPMAFCQGGLYKGNKQPTDLIGWDIIKSFTASFGITALNELNILIEGIPLHESDQIIVNSIVDHIQSKVDEFKEEDGFLYALYGVPAESLAGTQCQQFKARYGVIEGVSDRSYFSNSFHCHVSAELTPYEKQDLEEELFHKINGGHIQYCRFNNPENTSAIKSVVLRGMIKGFYQGVNFDLVICEDCGHRPNRDVEECPICKSKKILAISRACGYISYRKVGGDTRFNDSKLDEIHDRVSM